MLHVESRVGGAGDGLLVWRNCVLRELLEDTTSNHEGMFLSLPMNQHGLQSEAECGVNGVAGNGLQ